MSAPSPSPPPPNDSYFNILGISKKKHNHSIYSVSCSINKSLRIASCLKWEYCKDDNRMTLGEHSDIDVEIWTSDIPYLFE